MKVLYLMIVLAAGAAAQAPTQAQTATQHAPDGGTRLEIESIAVFPLTGSPFSATVTTEVMRNLADGSTATIKNRRRIARDSSGRIFQERAFFTPNGDTEPRIRALQYTDPSLHEVYDCIVAEKTCYVEPYRRSAIAAMPSGVGGLEACGCATPRGRGYSVQQEALGQKTIENVDAVGSREIATFPTGQFGNDKPQPVVKEFWYSPRLGLNLVTKRFDPRSGSQNFIVDPVSLDEPDPKMFEPPADYQIVRQVVVRERAQAMQ